MCYRSYINKYLYTFCDYYLLDGVCVDIVANLFTTMVDIIFIISDGE